MPNRPGTKRRSVRVSDELWADAILMAEEQGISVSEMMRRDLERHVKRWRKTRDTRRAK